MLQPRITTAPYKCLSLLHCHFYILTFFGFTAKNIDDTHLHVSTFFRYKPLHALITLYYLGKSVSYCLNLGLTMSETGYESIW